MFETSKIMWNISYHVHRGATQSCSHHVAVQITSKPKVSCVKNNLGQWRESSFSNFYSLEITCLWLKSATINRGIEKNTGLISSQLCGIPESLSFWKNNGLSFKWASQEAAVTSFTQTAAQAPPQLQNSLSGISRKGLKSLAKYKWLIKSDEYTICLQWNHIRYKLKKSSFRCLNFPCRQMHLKLSNKDSKGSLVSPVKFLSKSTGMNLFKTR